jgi:hypothetical protein
MATDVTGFPSVASEYRPRIRSYVARLGAGVIGMRLAQARHRQSFHLAELPERALISASRRHAAESEDLA